MVISVNNNGTLNISTEAFKHTTGTPATFSQKSGKAMEEVFKHIEDNAATIAEDKKLKEAVTKALPDLEALAGQTKGNVDAFKRIKGALEFAPGANVTETTAGLVRNPLARKMLSDKALKGMGVTELAELDGFIAAKDKMAGYAKDVKANKDAIRGVLVEHLDAKPEIADAIMGKSKAKFSGVAAELAKDMAKAGAKIDIAHAAIKGYDAQLQNPALKGKEIARIEELRAKEVGKMLKATEGKDFGGKLFSGIEKADPKLFEELKDLDSSVESHIDSAIKTGSAAAKDAGKGSWFTKSADELKVIAKKEGVAVEKLSRWTQRTGAGKAAVVAGAAAVTYAIVSAIGNKGPGEKAAEVSRSREGEPSVGRA